MANSLSSISISVCLVDGSLAQFDADPGIIERLNELQARGLQGKKLIHELLSDDWGLPPLSIEISGHSAIGELIDIKIPYL